jgi:hypothetical protein
MKIHFLDPFLAVRVFVTLEFLRLLSIYALIYTRTIDLFTSTVFAEQVALTNTSKTKSFSLCMLFREEGQKHQASDMQHVSEEKTRIDRIWFIST